MNLTSAYTSRDEILTGTAIKCCRLIVKYFEFYASRTMTLTSAVTSRDELGKAGLITLNLMNFNKEL